MDAPLKRCLLLAIGCALASCSTVNVRFDAKEMVREGIDAATQLGQASEAMLSSAGRATTGLLRAAVDADGPSPANRALAAGHYLEAAMASRELLISAKTATPEATAALLTLHNDSLARFAELWREASDAAGQALPAVPHEEGSIQVRWSKDSTYPSSYFDKLIAARAAGIKGITPRSRSGLGAALVGVREQRPERADEMRFYAPRGLHAPATMTLDAANGDSVTLSLRNPLLEQSVRAGERTYPVAADFSAPLAVNFAGRNEWLRGLSGFFDAETRSSISGIHLSEPYDPERIPVLLIHGLISVPIIWRDTIPRIHEDSELARRYQLMTFSYPSSYPIIDSASLLRDELRDLRAKFDPQGQHPLSRNMDVIGHSMGGVLARTLATDIGDHLWNELSSRSLEELNPTAEEKARLMKKAFFRSDPAVRRLLFYSTPHRGAHLAENGVIGLASRAAALPQDVFWATASSLSADEPVFKVQPRRKWTAIQSLKPGAPMIEALAASPMRQDVIFHSVIGDRGKGDSPNSSDGVVEYWSSHLEGAASELIVPSGHSSFKDPGGIEEAVRILRIHAGLPAQPLTR
jgi:pimeloyl-ACP methyl ester carboxylesterase